jgi:hypothetical protein
VDMTNYTCLTELVHFAKRAERQVATSYKYTASWRHSQQQGDVTPQFQQQGAATPKSSSRGTNRSIPPSSKQLDSKGKAVSSNQPTSSTAATQSKTSKIECRSFILWEVWTSINHPCIPRFVSNSLFLSFHHKISNDRRQKRCARKGRSTEICLESTMTLCKNDCKFPTGTNFHFGTLIFKSGRNGELVL